LVPATPFQGFRFHELPHQAISELAEAGAPDATLMALAGHMSRRMLEHYSHVRMAAKRHAVELLTGGLLEAPTLKEPKTDPSSKLKNVYVTIHVTIGQLPLWPSSHLIEFDGGRDRTRTCDLLRVKQAL